LIALDVLLQLAPGCAALAACAAAAPLPSIAADIAKASIRRRARNIAVRRYRSHSPSYHFSVDSVLARDPEALAAFYDRRAGTVREYCALICPADLVDEATFVAFVDFLGRVDAAGEDADFDELLWRSTRGSAAGRVQVADAPSSDGPASDPTGVTEPGPICRAMPELLAAYVSGELAPDAELDRHLVECAVCRRTAKRFREAEAAFTREPGESPPEEIRRRWLEIALSDPAARG